MSRIFLIIAIGGQSPTVESSQHLRHYRPAFALLEVSKVYSEGIHYLLFCDVFMSNIPNTFRVQFGCNLEVEFLWTVPVSLDCA